MNLRALRQKARGFSIDEALLEAVVEGENPKKALIALIVALVEAPSVLVPAADAYNEGSPCLGPDKVVAGSPCDGVSLASLPSTLMAALRAVEAVDTAAEEEVEGDGKAEETAPVGVPITGQLVRLKQTYVADLTAALNQIELAIAADQASAATITAAKGKSGYFRDADESAEQQQADGGDASGSTVQPRQLSHLEGMAADLLQGRVMGSLSVAALARLGGASKSLLATVRGVELQPIWEAHWSARWSGGGGRGWGSGRSGGGMAEAFSYRANLEMAWHTTRWGSSSSSDTGGGVVGQTMMLSTVSNSSMVLSVENTAVCAVSYDPTTAHAVTGDTEGLVRLWDVSRCFAGGGGGGGHGGGDPCSREARLGVLRMHNKDHAVRWAAVHGRRLLVSCAAKDTTSIATGQSSQQAGRLVLADLDEARLNASQRCMGVASCSIDAQCGFIGTGDGGSDGTGNGIPEKFGWAGVGHHLLGKLLYLRQ